MASIKVKFRSSAVANREGVIYYQVIHERKVRQVASQHKIFPSEWDEKTSMVKVCPHTPRTKCVISTIGAIRADVERFMKIIRRLDHECLPYSADDVVRLYNQYCHDYTLANYMGAIISNLRKNGRIRTSETYTSALHSFRRFLSLRERPSDIMLDSITSELMEAYEAWHKDMGNSLNTISFYTRILRAVYNRAVEENIIDNRRPFRRVYTGIEKTTKRALPLGIITSIRKLDLSENPALDYARDMFLISFMFRGMSFIDMAFLRKSDVMDGFIVYRRRKTGQLLTIEITREMLQILNKYPENESDYLLPIIKKKRTNERSAYRNAGCQINYNLKKIASMVGVTIPLTLYVARHSWASAAMAKGIPVNIISEGMGHESESTTRIYLSGLDTALINRANSLIISSI